MVYKNSLFTKIIPFKRLHLYVKAINCFAIEKSIALIYTNLAQRENRRNVNYVLVAKRMRVRSHTIKCVISRLLIRPKPNLECLIKLLNSIFHTVHVI